MQPFQQQKGLCKLDSVFFIQLFHRDSINFLPEWKAASKHRIPNIWLCLYSSLYYFPVCTPAEVCMCVCAHEYVEKRQTIPKQLGTIYQYNHNKPQLS